jgi:hypothetical protein
MRRREHHSECREDDVEAGVRIGKGFGIGHLEGDLHVFGLSAIATLAVLVAIYAATTVRDPMAKRVKSLNERREQLKAGIVASTSKRRKQIANRNEAADKVRSFLSSLKMAQGEQVGKAQVTTAEYGTASHELAGLSPGVYRVEAKATIAGRQVDASDIFLVREGGTELDRPTGDPTTLEKLATGTGGSALGPVDELPDLELDPPRIVRVDKRTDIELWSRPGLLFLIIGLLGLEWLLRQRSGYL